MWSCPLGIIISLLFEYTLVQRLLGLLGLFRLSNSYERNFYSLLCNQDVLQCISRREAMERDIEEVVTTALWICALSENIYAFTN